MSMQRYSFTPHPIETILTGQDGRDRHPGDPSALRLGRDQGSELSRLVLPRPPDRLARPHRRVHGGFGGDRGHRFMVKLRKAVTS